jgi:hypothetical protein
MEDHLRLTIRYCLVVWRGTGSGLIERRPIVGAEKETVIGIEAAGWTYLHRRLR